VGVEEIGRRNSRDRARSSSFRRLRRLRETPAGRLYICFAGTTVCAVAVHSSRTEPGRVSPVILNEATWQEIRKRVEEECMPLKPIKNKNRKESPLWEDRELARRHAAAVDALFEECEGLPVHEQLIAIMERMGSPVLRSNVRRDAQGERAAGSEGDGQNPAWMEKAEESPFRKVQGLILDAMPAGDYTIFMKTREGAGLTVATAIDESRWEELAAAVAAPSAVVLLTENRSCQARLMVRLKYFANRYGGERSEVERRPLYG
jgi:hypothetical protein